PPPLTHRRPPRGRRRGGSRFACAAGLGPPLARRSDPMPTVEQCRDRLLHSDWMADEVVVGALWLVEARRRGQAVRGTGWTAEEAWRRAGRLAPAADRPGPPGRPAPGPPPPQ